MKWYLSLLSLLSTNFLFSQAQIPLSFNEAAMLATNELEDVQGTPYLYEEFKNGEIYYGGKHKIEQIPLRLDLFRDRLEYKDEKGVIMAFGNPDRMDFIIIDKEVFVYLPKNRAYKISGFLKMWNTRMPCILTKMNVNFLKAEEAKPFDLHEPRPDRLERVPDNHFIMVNKEEIERVTSVKKLIKYLGAHSEELTEYAEKIQISQDDPEALAKLVNYYIQLEQVK